MIYVVYTIWAILHIAITILICLAIILIYEFISTRLQRYYRRWEYKRTQQRWEKEYELILQERRKKELHRKERERYPLFYWKESLNGNH